MKFGILQQMVNQIAVSWPKIEILKIQNGGGRHLENRFFDHNSTTDFSDFSEILYEEAERHADKGHMTKNCKF